MTSINAAPIKKGSGTKLLYVAEAYLIRNGQLAEAVRGATLCGNGPQVLMQVDRVGTGLEFDMGTCGKNGQAAPVTDAQPMLRVPQLTVGGLRPMSDYFKD